MRLKTDVPTRRDGIADKVTRARSSRRTLLVASILVAALLLRLNNIGFGLPSLYDPDEPLFMVKAAGLLADHTMNPHWFGHPGTTTIYLTAIVEATVFAGGVITGRYASLADFVNSAYADPTIIFVSARIAMALLGTACVGLTYLLGKRLFGATVGLIAALLLALNSLHIAWSQVVRTDVQASVFMLAALLVACRLADAGQAKHALWAGLLTGFAIATKWPAATVFAGVIGAAVCYARSAGGGWRHAGKRVAIAGFATILGVFIASPFIFIDFGTVLSNLAGEARPFHVGHTGGGFLSNLATYLGVFAADSMGWAGVALALAGVLLAFVSPGKARYVLGTASLAFFIGICAQRLIWSRWLIPGLPYLTIFASVAIVKFAHWVSRESRLRRNAALAGVGGLAVVASAFGAVGQARERRNDTRAEAAQWIVQHASTGSTIVIEHLELKLRSQPFRFLFPIGRQGCRDGPALMTSGIGYDDVERVRGGNPVVDLGNVNPNLLSTCRADYAVLTYYDLYLREAHRFPNEVMTYRRILAGGRTVAIFRPKPGRIGGPIVRIVALPSQSQATDQRSP